MSTNGKPKEWKLSRLGDLADKVGSGITPTGGRDTYLDSGIPFIRSQNVLHGCLDLSDAAYISHAQHAEMSNSVVRPRDVLLNITGASIGRSAIVPLGVEEANVNQHVCIIRPSDSLDPNFLSNLLNSWLGQRLVYQSQAGGNREGLNYEQIRGFRLLVPPLPEQQKIAAIFSTWDRAIELTQKLIAAKQKRKQALMQQLLTGKVRLPEFQGDVRNQAAGIVRVPSAVRRGLYPPSVQPGIPKITHRPKGWNETTMGNMLHIEKRPIELLQDKEYQLVVAKRNRGGIEPRERLRGYEVKTPTQFEVRAGDFVISKRQIIHGACGVVPASLDGAVVSNEYSVCTVNGSLDMEFLKYLSHTLYFQQTCFHASVGVALEKMIFRLEEWLKFPFLIPPIDEQKAIVSVLAAMDNAICLLSKRLSLLSQQKKGLMQQLLTGKVRVKVDCNTTKEAVT